MNQAALSIRNYLLRLGGIAIGRRVCTVQAEPKMPRALLRVGYAGNLAIGDDADLGAAVGAVLDALNSALGRRSPPAALRLVGQLAEGADSLLADAALAAGAELHAVLPGSKRLVLNDFDRADDSPTRAVTDRRARFEGLLARAARVTELDASQPRSESIGYDDYSQCARVILASSDVLLVICDPATTSAPGGTRWMAERGAESGLPVLLIDPADLEHLEIRTREGSRPRTTRVALVDPGALRERLTALLQHVLPTPGEVAFPFRMGWFERRFLEQLRIEPNEGYWNARWTPPEEAPGDVVPEAVRSHIDRCVGTRAQWADHRAAAMAELVRGTFGLCAFLGLLAVGCALVSLLAPAASTAAKVTELICLLAVLGFIRREHRMRWREQWLVCRQLERRLDHDAWLLTLARTSRPHDPAEHRRIGSAAMTWLDAFERAVMRETGLPTMTVDAGYLGVVGRLVRSRLVLAQAAYCRTEAASQRTTDELLDRWIKLTFGIALVATAGYLLVTGGFVLAAAIAGGDAHKQLFEGPAERPWKLFSSAVAAIGLLMPGIAAALASLRSHGEYAQMARRFEAMDHALSELADRQVETAAPSGELVSVVENTVAILSHEVSSWGALFDTKEIEAA